jgi:hypothetical protein
LLDLDIGIAEGTASEADERRDGVLEVGDFLVLCGLSKVSALGAEAYQRPESCQLQSLCGVVVFAYGVARLETSFAIYQQSAHVPNTPWTQGMSSTYNIDTTVARNSNDAVERTQINAHDRHVYR